MLNEGCKVPRQASQGSGVVVSERRHRVARDVPKDVPKAAPTGPFDGIQWPLTMAASAYGVRFSIRANQADLGEELSTHLPPGAQYEEFSASGRVYSVIVDENFGAEQKRFSVFINDAPL